MKWNIELNIVTLERKHFYGKYKADVSWRSLYKIFRKCINNISVLTVMKSPMIED